MKIYLDTSVISHIDAPHKPEAEAVTQRFFRLVRERSEEYDLFISPVVQLEVSNCPEPKRSKLFDLLSEIQYTSLQKSSDVDSLVKRYLEESVLGAKHFRDLTHIAHAVVARCDCIVSWNFEHFVNVRTIKRVNMVNVACNYGTILIVSPQAIIGEKADEND